MNPISWSMMQAQRCGDDWRKKMDTVTGNQISRKDRMELLYQQAEGLCIKSRYVIAHADRLDRDFSPAEYAFLVDNENLWHRIAEEFELLRSEERREKIGAALGMPSKRRQPQRKRSPARAPKEPKPATQYRETAPPKPVNECEEISALLRRAAGLNPSGDRGRVIHKYLEDEDANGAFGNKLRAYEEDR